MRGAGLERWGSGLRYYGSQAKKQGEAESQNPDGGRRRRHGDGSVLPSAAPPTWSLERSDSRSRMGLRPRKPAYGRTCTPLAAAAAAAAATVEEDEDEDEDSTGQT